MHARNRTWLLGSDPVERCRQRTLPVEGGDGSTLSLDFTTGVLDPRLTFTRASGGTYVGNDGFVYGVDFATSSSLAIGTGSKSVTLTATAGASRRYEIGQTVYIANGANNMSGAVTAYNASTQVLTINATSTSGSGSFTSWIVGNASARFDYDPSTTPPQPRGLLIEGSAINYMLESNSLTGYSNSGMAVVTAGSDSNPTGIANSALQIYATVGGTFHGYYRTITAGTNTQVTVSIWAKARTYTHLFLSDLASGRAAVRFNLSTGATDNNFGAGYVSAKATPFPNGWWRCEMVVNVTASTAYGWAFVGVPSGATLGQFGAQYTGTGNAADGIYCYGFQVEGGSGASSYIPTGASTGSRGQDAMTMTDISSLNFNQSGGTVMMQIDGGPRDLNTFPYFAQFEKSPSGRGWGFLRMNISSTVGPRIFGTAFDNAGSVIITASNHLRPSGKIKFATSLEPSVARMTWVIAGGSALVNTAAAGTLATIGSLKFNNTTETAATDFGSVWVSQFKYWPTVLPESQMQALTT
jgi:hypothetical protein